MSKLVAGLREVERLFALVCRVVCVWPARVGVRGVDFCIGVADVCAGCGEMIEEDRT